MKSAAAHFGTGPLPLAACLALVAIQQAAAQESVDRREPADPRGEVEIVNVSGEVTVRGWDRAEVQVKGELGRGVEKLDFRRDEDHTLIKVVLPKGHSSGGSSDLVVNVPRECSLIIKTVSADQTITDVRGEQKLQSVSGDIQTESWGELEAKTVSGRIAVRGHGGDESVRVTSVSGSVDLNDIGSELEINTVTGDMKISMKELESARINTTNGQLHLRTALARDANISAEAINGDLRFDLQGRVDAQIDIETFNGDIDNCFGPSPRRTREHGPGNELRFTEGKGDARLRVKTLNGNVTLCKR